MEDKKGKKKCLDFGSFVISEECDKCSRNLDCLRETFLAEHCFNSAFWSEYSEALDCNNSCADAEQKKRCSIYFYIKNMREKFCEKFGHPTVCKDCLLCKNFSDCESAEICLSNLGISLAEAKEIIEDQKESFSGTFSDSDDEECFGRFSFDECWKSDCEFKIECLRKVGISPDGTCIYFPSSVEGELSKVCSKCLFEKVCISLWESEKEKITREKKLKQIFNSNLSVGKLRELLVEE